jgi:tyrosinase
MADDDSQVRRPAVPSPVRIRRDIHRLAENDPIIVFYERAIQRMRQGNVLASPTSWRYQAAIHDYPLTLASATTPAPGDPFSQAGEAAPSADERRDYWRKCEHGSWFFLAWHRMYLHYFEKIVAKVVVDLGGPNNWALPYWNYSRPAEGGIDPRKLPLAFQRPQIPDERRPGQMRNNFLHVAQRVAAANSNGSFLADADVDLSCLKSVSFGTFEGARLHNHPLGGGVAGAVENVPHNLVHAALGQSNGFMNGSATAPLEPMFWLHHSNIDRLWDVWVQRQKHLGNLDRNPDLARDAKAHPADVTDDQGWLNTVFLFHDENGAKAQLACKDVLNPRLPPLSYEYEDTSDPFHGNPN